MLAALLLVLFVVLAASVRRQDGIVLFDVALAQALSFAMPESLLWGLSWFTYLGDRDFLVLVSAAMVLALLLRRKMVLAAGCVAATAGAGIWNWVLKHAFERARPEHLHGFVQAQGWSFPSGHASAAMAVYGVGCYLLLCRVAPAWRLACLCGAVALIALIGASRILLQVHFFSDVAAGFAVSGAWLLVCLLFTENARRLRPAGSFAAK